MMERILTFGLILSTAHGAHFLVTSHAHLDIKIDAVEIGRITIGLFGELAPKSVKNFETICTKGINGKTYISTKFHRVIDKSIIQGGDIVSNDGNGIISIYGYTFPDESLDISHSGPGFLAMANRGPNTNGCQFYITTMATPWLDGKNNIFGKVVKGAGIVHRIEKERTDSDFVPLRKIEISDCSVEKVGSYYISDNLYDLWSWIRATAVPLGMSFSILTFFYAILRKLNASTDKIQEIQKTFKAE